MRGFFYLLPAALFMFLAASGEARGNYPAPDGYVTDRAGIIVPADRAAAAALAGELEQKTGAQAALVTVDTTAPETIEQYAVNLFQAWGIGQRGRDNGLLILVAHRDRTARIEVGYGLEGIITDARAHQVYRQTLVPAFQRGEFGPGLIAALAQLAGDIAADAGVALTGPGVNAGAGTGPEEPSLPGRILGTIFSLFLMMFILTAFGPLGLIFFGAGAGRGGYWSGGGMSGGFGGGGFGGGMSGGGGAGGGW